MIEQTLVLIKPDAVERKLIGEIVGRFETKGFSIVAMKMFQFDEKLVDKHYNEHLGKDYFEPLKHFIMSGPCAAIVLEGEECISVVRAMMGNTYFAKAQPGTIRGDYSTSNRRNLVHGSDSPERAKIEIELFFNDDELFNS